MDSPENISALLSASMPSGTVNRMKFEKVRQKWPSIVGSRMASKSRVVSMENRKVLVCASSPPAAQHLQMKSRALVSVLREVWGLDIDEIKVFVGNVNRVTDSLQVKEKKDHWIEVKEEEIRKETEKIQESIEDPALASSLASLKVICRVRFGKIK